MSRGRLRKGLFDGVSSGGTKGKEVFRVECGSRCARGGMVAQGNYFNVKVPATLSGMAMTRLCK